MFDKNCAWTNYSGESNCQYLKDILSWFKKYNIFAGVQGTQYSWETLFGNSTSCLLEEAVPLWWISWDNKPDYDDFKPFSNWKIPSRKQFKFSAYVCGAEGELSYSLY